MSSPFMRLFCKKANVPLILSLNCSKMVFIGSSFRMNATGKFSFRLIGTQIP